MSWNNFDRSLLIHQTFNSAINRKLNQEILNQIYYQNQELRDLNYQANKSNILQKKFLELQIEEIKKKEKNKFLKFFAFQLSEIIHLITLVKDELVKIYLLKKYVNSIEENLIFCQDNLEEINDKVFCRECFTKLSNLNEEVKPNIAEYNLSEIGLIDGLFQDLLNSNDRLNKLNLPLVIKPNNYNPPQKSFWGLNKSKIEWYDQQYQIHQKLISEENLKNQAYYDQNKNDLETKIKDHKYFISLTNIKLRHNDFDTYLEKIHLIEKNFPIQNSTNTQNIGGTAKEYDPDDRDPMFEDAARLIVLHQQGSTSLIQRKMKLGYNRAGRIIDQLEAAGIVGAFEGSKARDVLYPDEYSLERYLETLQKPKD